MSDCQTRPRLCPDLDFGAPVTAWMTTNIKHIAETKSSLRNLNKCGTTDATSMYFFAHYKVTLIWSIVVV